MGVAPTRRARLGGCADRNAKQPSAHLAGFKTNVITPASVWTTEPNAMDGATHLPNWKSRQPSAAAKKSGKLWLLNEGDHFTYVEARIPGNPQAACVLAPFLRVFCIVESRDLTLGTRFSIIIWYTRVAPHRTQEGLVMGISETERLRANYDRLLSLASEARGRGQTSFADLLADRASKYLDQIAALEKQSNNVKRGTTQTVSTRKSREE